jgi:hypothetical protein
MLFTVLMRAKAYKSNRNVSYSCQYHLVWCSKYRRKVLSEQIAERLKHIIAEVCQEHQAELAQLEVLPDHVHVLGVRSPVRDSSAGAFAQRPLIAVVPPGVSGIEKEAPHTLDQQVLRLDGLRSAALHHQALY